MPEDAVASLKAMDEATDPLVLGGDVGEMRRTKNQEFFVLDS